MAVAGPARSAAPAPAAAEGEREQPEDAEQEEREEQEPEAREAEAPAGVVDDGARGRRGARDGRRDADLVADGAGDEGDHRDEEDSEKSAHGCDLRWVPGRSPGAVGLTGSTLADGMCRTRALGVAGSWGSNRALARWRPVREELIRTGSGTRAPYTGGGPNPHARSRWNASCCSTATGSSTGATSPSSTSR